MSIASLVIVYGGLLAKLFPFHKLKFIIAAYERSLMKCCGTLVLWSLWAFCFVVFFFCFCKPHKTLVNPLMGPLERMVNVHYGQQILLIHNIGLYGRVGCFLFLDGIHSYSFSRQCYSNLVDAQYSFCPSCER